MSAITPFLRNSAFDPADIHAMSLALENVCVALGVNDDRSAREEIAGRIVELASRGERNWISLRDRVLVEATSGDNED